jgi:cholinesterase
MWISSNYFHSESAGGASVDYYSYAYPEDPIVSGIIAESGAVTSFSNPPPMNNSAFWFDAAKNVGCPTNDAKASVACMRTKSMDDILKASKVANPLQAVLGKSSKRNVHRLTLTNNW